MYSDIEIQIHVLEQEAYCAVLRALKAQSDALTWDKEELITNLRRELKVSDDEHREVLSKVNDDPVLRRIREWRKGGESAGARSNLLLPVHDQLQSPTISASRKRQKASHSVPFGTPRQSLHPLPITVPVQPSSFLSRWEPPLGIVGRRPERVCEHFPRITAVNFLTFGLIIVFIALRCDFSFCLDQLVLSSTPTQYQHANHGPGAFFNSEHVQRTFDPLIGRKVMTRLPNDSNFYEAIITEYNPVEGRHALVYDSNTPNETVEWVDLKEFPPEDIRWIGDSLGNFRQNESDAHVIEQSTVTGTRVRLSLRSQHENEASRQSQNGFVSTVGDEIEILHTDTLIEKVERMLSVSHPGVLEFEKAKKMLKDHEQALIDVISKLADVCDSRNETGQGHMQKQLRGPNIAPEIRAG